MALFDEMQRYYENEGREDARLAPNSVQYLEYLTALRALEQHLPPAAAVLDSCAGTGVYAFALAGRGHRVTAGDIIPYNVQLMEQKQREGDVPLEAIYCGDACALDRFGDAQFDAVLCMGALYHLPNEADRRLAVAEALRVLKPGGLLFASFMNRYAVIMNNMEPELQNLDDMLRFAQNGREGIFYASTVDESEALMAGFGLEKRAHLALDGMTYFVFHTAALLRPEAFERWAEWHLATCAEQSVLHQSYHTLYVGAKPGGKP